MFQLKDRVCQQNLVPLQGEIAIWQRETVSSLADMDRVMQTIMLAMKDAGFPDKEIFRLHLALEEAIVNANKHGHDGDWSKPVSVRYHVGEKAWSRRSRTGGWGSIPHRYRIHLTLKTSRNRLGVVYS
jgi:hypothetical protein